MIKKILKNNKGLTLLEIVVSVTIFAFMIIAATGIFQMVIESQRRAIASQNMQESIRYFLEAISKELRLAKKSQTGECAGMSNVYGGDPTRLTFLKHDIIDDTDICISYYQQGDNLMVDRKVGSSATTTLSTLSNKVKVTNLKFIAVNDDPVIPNQPNVTVLLEVEAVGKDLHKVPLKIQTTISSRFYD
ncbi:MAG: Prepilin-type cleavage/methylation protein [Parcubacteria group bacterium GW2011_GWE2_38_18]|nr:MAG: Prepilin-type cleavage/methylation protein [Parcubacteria group bacterium GW2011_GWE2_38_18]